MSIKRVVVIIMTICVLLPLSALYGRAGEDDIRTVDTEDVSVAKLLYMGHASIRITTTEGKVIYIDPFAGEGYEPAADLILITHEPDIAAMADRILHLEDGKIISDTAAE